VRAGSPFLLPLLAGCIGSSETCVLDRLTYAGTATGQVLVKVMYTDAQRVDSQQIGGYPSVQIPLFRGPPGTVVGGGTCWGGSIARHETANATAWIDVGARFPSGCTGVAFEQCAPQRSDPQGHGTFAIRDFEQNYLDIVISDH
jgi:hypothetical protein